MSTNSPSDQHVLIIGGSHTAASVAFGLRQLGWNGAVTIVSEEQQLPYQRPPLSKDFLAGNKQLDDLLLKPAAAYQDKRIQLKLGCVATAIDRANRVVTLANGDQLSYHQLVLATGARPRPLPFAGSESDNLFYLRSYDDVTRIQAALTPSCKVAIVGGGYIGLETAASLTKMGCQVSIIEAMPRLLARVTAPQLSAYYQALHQRHGVDIRVDCQLESFVCSDNQITALQLAGGEQLDCDIVIVGIGVIPNVELAAAAGLAVENGVVVDPHGRSSDPDIYAAGDCSYHYNPIYQRQLRLESVQNTVDQGMAVARTICAAPQTYNALPWFWSDQYDIKLQIAGLSQGFDQTVVRGDLGSDAFSLFYLAQGRLLAADCINRPQEFMISKRLLTSDIAVTAQQLADCDFNLMSLFKH